jgi:hypothetical protein
MLMSGELLILPRPSLKHRAGIEIHEFHLIELRAAGPPCKRGRPLSFSLRLSMRVSVQRAVVCRQT